ncbi:hypothetical protein QUC31_009871 [Theobroma cacao]
MKTLKRGKPRKRSYGNHGRKNSSFSSTETGSLGRCKQINGSSPKVVGKKLCLQSRPQQVKLTKTYLVKLKVQMRDSAESLMAAQKAANLTEAEFAQMIMRRNEVMDILLTGMNELLKMKEIEAFLMLKLGLL